ncbi:MAG: hypothetical protein WEE67_00935 [Chloroflexota bacterium]
MTSGPVAPVIRIGSIVIRVDDLRRQTAFWSAALDYVIRADPESNRICVVDTTWQPSEAG